jgi:hypothetical protein
MAKSRNSDSTRGRRSQRKWPSYLDDRQPFTERQTRVLVMVMLHSGVFVERQYCAFAGIVHGQKTHDFLERITTRGMAKAIAVARCTVAASSTFTTSRCTRPLARWTTGIGSLCPRVA